VRRRPCHVGGMTARFKDLCLDAGDHHLIADWWCAAMGYERRPVAEDWPVDWPVPIQDPAGKGPLIWVNPVPEFKSGKNRMHIDVQGDVDELVALGAKVVRVEDDEIEWTVMADPEGNEFCVSAP